MRVKGSRKPGLRTKLGRRDRRSGWTKDPAKIQTRGKGKAWYLRTRQQLKIRRENGIKCTCVSVNQCPHQVAHDLGLSDPYIQVHIRLNQGEPFTTDHIVSMGLSRLKSRENSKKLKDSQKPKKN